MSNILRQDGISLSGISPCSPQLWASPHHRPCVMLQGQSPHAISASSNRHPRTDGRHSRSRQCPGYRASRPTPSPACGRTDENALRMSVLVAARLGS